MNAAAGIKISEAGMYGEREYLIEVGRWAAQKAFRYIRAAGESPVAYFDGAKRPKPPRRSKTKPRIHVVHAVATRTPGFSRPNLVGRQTIDGHIHRAIAELEPLEFLWVQYWYRPEGLARTQHGEHFQRAYFQRYQAEQRLQNCKTGTRRMVRYLISVAIANEGNPRQRAAKPQAYDLSTRNWNKTYRPHWHRVCADISAIDSNALYEIGRKVDKIVPVA